MYLWTNGCPSLHQSGLSLWLFWVPLYNLFSFLFHCCFCVWNQHCLEWKICCTHSRFPEASVSERQISRIVWTIRNSRFPTRVLGVTRRILSHRYAVSRDDTTCASFHLNNMTIRWGAFFQIFSLGRIRAPNCNTTQNSVYLLQYQYKWILLQTLQLLLFWNNVFPNECSLSQILVNTSDHIWSGRDVV